MGGAGGGKDSISNFIASKRWAFKITCLQLGAKRKRPRVPRHRQGDKRWSTATPQALGCWRNGEGKSLTAAGKEVQEVTQPPLGAVWTVESGDKPAGRERGSLSPGARHRGSCLPSSASSKVTEPEPCMLIRSPQNNTDLRTETRQAPGHHLPCSYFNLLFFLLPLPCQPGEAVTIATGAPAWA